MKEVIRGSEEDGETRVVGESGPVVNTNAPRCGAESFCSTWGFWGSSVVDSTSRFESDEEEEVEVEGVKRRVGELVYKDCELLSKEEEEDDKGGERGRNVRRGG